MSDPASPLPVILDGDPGLDDAVAWWLALASPQLKVLGVTAVHGNVGLERTVRNTGVILALAGARGAAVPYFVGADRPLVRGAVHAEAVHGESGLPAQDLPDPAAAPQAGHAVDFLLDTAAARPGVTVVATGPLTNLALALRLNPGWAAQVREVVWMGGSTGLGNRTPAAEFNALADPHAARVVFESGVALRMVGLNVTMTCLATPDRLDVMRALGSRVGSVSAELLGFYAGVYRQRYGLAGGALHDPLAVGAVLWPDLFGWKAMHVHVETQEGVNFGRTTCDVHGVTEEPRNAQVAVDVDEAEFFRRMAALLGSYPA